MLTVNESCVVISVAVQVDPPLPGTETSAEVCHSLRNGEALIAHHATVLQALEAVSALFLHCVRCAVECWLCAAQCSAVCAGQYIFKQTLDSNPETIIAIDAENLEHLSQFPQLFDRIHFLMPSGPARCRTSVSDRSNSALSQAGSQRFIPGRLTALYPRQAHSALSQAGSQRFIPGRLTALYPRQAHSALSQAGSMRCVDCDN